MAGGSCQVEKWTVEELVHSVMPEVSPLNGKRITVPKFQRNLVWEKKQEIKFIDSLKKGYPFGSLLLFKKGNRDHLEEFSLIDGLQRTNTLRRYFLQPNDYFAESDVDSDFCVTVLTHVGMPVVEDNIESAKSHIAQWVRSRKGFEDLHGFSAWDMVHDVLGPKFGVHTQALGVADFRARVSNFLGGVKRSADISKVDIPVMIYHGPEADLPDIFERINSAGSVLNKYQVFAATWSEATFQIRDSELVSVIRSRYDSAKSKGYIIEGFDPETFAESDFTLFEYLFGLGKLLSKKHPSLFGRYSVDNADTADSVAFNLVTACCGLPLDRMAELPHRFKGVGARTMLERLLKATAFVEISLRPFIGLRANQQDAKTVYHAETQIVALISLVYMLKYDPKFSSGWTSYESALKRGIPQWYLFEIITQFWRGPVDKKLTAVLEAGPDGRYLKPIRRSQWESALSDWFSGQLESQNVRRQSLSSVSLLFLKYIYTHTVVYYENYGVEFEIEHLIPVERLKRAVQIAGRGLPVGCVGNLVLLEKRLNRVKRGMTISEYFADQVRRNKLSAADAISQIAEYRSVIFQDPAEIQIPVGPDGQDRLTPEFYDGFLRKRFEILKEKFYELNRYAD